MKIKLSLAFVALFAVASVHSSSPMRNADFDRIMDMLQQQRRSIQTINGDYNDHMAKIRQYVSLLHNLDEENEIVTQSDEIGPNFSQAQFLRMLRRDSQAAYQRKCKKITGDDNAYMEAQIAKAHGRACIRNWFETEEMQAGVQQAKMTNNYKPIMKKICAKRSGFFRCIEAHKDGISRCYYPSEIKDFETLHRLMSNLLDLICSNEKDDFAVFEFKGEGEQCLASNRVKIMTCVNRAAYSLAKRVVEKLIENERFEFEMDAEDCKEFDATKSCLVSSVETCPTVKDMLSSAFQIVRNETECAKTTST